MTRFTFMEVVLLSSVLCCAQSNGRPASRPQSNAEPYTIRLWEKEAPGALGNEESDIPTLTVYAPLDPTRSRLAVIVAPGGAYVHLASNHEGRQVANWLNALGATAFVLKYRLGPRYHHPIELGDAKRAMRLVRSRAEEFHIAPDRIGFMGFSAGGHLASSLGTHFDGGDPQAVDPIERVNCRPDFLILAYPVISFTAPYAHAASGTNLLGENSTLELRQELSSELHVTSSTPPTFLFTTDTDTVVPPENSVAFYLALRKAGVSAELHVFEKGPHGVGLRFNDPVLGEWPVLLANWLRARGLIKTE